MGNPQSKKNKNKSKMLDDDAQVNETRAQEAVGADGAVAAVASEPATPEQPSLEGVSSQKLFEHLQSLLEAIKAVNQETVPERAISVFISEATKILECDRCTVFMVDEFTNELVIKVASGDVNIRIPTTAGIAGHVYTTGEVLNIPEAYDDDRFNRDIDTKSGYRTKSILCLPVQDKSGVTVAVLQAMNKKDEGGEPVAFTEADEMMASYLGGQVGIILRNTQLFEAARVAKGKVDAMLDIVHSLHGDLGINSLLFTITERTPALVDADRCTMYLVDRHHGELTSMHGAVEIRIPMDKGIAGQAATSNATVNIPDAYQDPRFNQEFDKKSGYRTKTILTMPVRSTNGDVIGVIQLINKAHGAVFSGNDENLLESFLGIAGSMLQTSQLFSESKQQLSEMELANQVAVTKSRDMAHMQSFAEEEEEEED